MQMIVNAERLEVGYVNSAAAEILTEAVAGKGLGGAVTVIGSSAKRLAFLAEWVSTELAKADTFDPEVLAAIRPILVAISDALGVDDIGIK